MAPPATILLVDDEPAVLDLVGRSLRRAGHAVVAMSKAEDALHWWAEHRDEVIIVVSDVIMPGISGIEMVATMRGDRPDLPVLFISGYPDRVPRSALGDRAPVLQKPFSSQELIEAVTALTR